MTLDGWFLWGGPRSVELQPQGPVIRFPDASRNEPLVIAEGTPHLSSSAFDSPGNPASDE